MASKLSPKQENFCQAYLTDFNATRAAKVAGYSEKTAYSQGFDLLKKPEIQARITELRSSTSKQFNITRERICQELARIAFSDVRMAFDADGKLLPPDKWPDELATVVSSIETEELFDFVGRSKVQTGVTKKVKMWEKVKALETLIKMLGYNPADKLNLQGDDGEPVKFNITMKI